MPVTTTLSPGLAASTASSNASSVAECGVSPSGIASGASCTFTTCLSKKPERLCSRRAVQRAPQEAHPAGSSMRPRSL